MTVTVHAPPLPACTVNPFPSPDAPEAYIRAPRLLHSLARGVQMFTRRFLRFLIELMEHHDPATDKCAIEDSYSTFRGFETKHAYGGTLSGSAA